MRDSVSRIFRNARDLSGRIVGFPFLFAAVTMMKRHSFGFVQLSSIVYY